MRQEERVRRIVWQQKIDAEKRSADELKTVANVENSSAEINRKFASNNVVEVHSVGEIKTLEEEVQIEKQQEENVPPAVESEPALNPGKFKKKSVK